MASEILSPLQGLQTVRYSELASSMIIIYDHLITLDQEIQLIWKSGWSWGKCLFLLNRYYALFIVVFNNYVLFAPGISGSIYAAFLSRKTLQGTGWFRWQGATGVTSFLVGELILQLRLYALWDLNKKVLAIMGGVYISAILASSLIMGYALSQIDTISFSVLGVSVCAPLNLPDVRYLFAFWIPIMISESVLCGLAMLRAFQSYRRRSTLLASGRALVAVLIRDSILYFVIMFVVYLCNTIIFLQNNVTDTEAAISYAVSLSCVMSSRLCLNVRGMIWQDSDITGDSSLPMQRNQWPVVVVGQNQRELSEFEMRELRSMRNDEFE